MAVEEFLMWGRVMAGGNFDGINGMGNSRKNKRGIVLAICALSALIIALPFCIVVRSHPPRWWIVQAMDVQLITGGVQYYKKEYGVMPPVTSNAQLIKVLMGDNPRKIEFIDMGPGQDERNASGEMIDPWGTPFQFWVDSNGKFHFRSAGPDKIFGTADDREWSIDSKDGLVPVQMPKP